MPAQAARSPALCRRIVLTMTGGGVLSLIGFRAHAETAAAEIAKIVAGRTAKPGGITLDLPSIAENGLVVPLTVVAESPMTEADHIKAIHVFADGNPNPLVASFRFTPAARRAGASIRIRLAQTQNVVVFAETSTGELRTASAEVKVTIGGCGG
jgi:sulfur-oxidizing protein SoxY